MVVLGYVQMREIEERDTVLIDFTSTLDLSPDYLRLSFPRRMGGDISLQIVVQFRVGNLNRLLFRCRNGFAAAALFRVDHYSLLLLDALVLGGGGVRLHQTASSSYVVVAEVVLAPKREREGCLHALFTSYRDDLQLGYLLQIFLELLGTIQSLLKVHLCIGAFLARQVVLRIGLS